MKNHLKCITAPKSWGLPRRGRTFVTRAKPSGHAVSNGLPLGIIIRDLLQLASTMSEVKKILVNKEIFVDGRRCRDHRFLVGLFDVLSIPALHTSQRMVFSSKGELTLVDITADEAKIKLCKVIGKTALSGGKIQYNLHDGRNILSETKATVGDSLLITVPQQNVQEVLPLRASTMVFISAGKNAGRIGVLGSITGREASYSLIPSGTEIGTVKQHLFVVGGTEAAITVTSQTGQALKTKIYKQPH